MTSGASGFASKSTEGETWPGADSLLVRRAARRRIVRHLAYDPAVIAHRAEPLDAAVALVGNDRVRVEALGAYRGCW